MKIGIVGYGSIGSRHATNAAALGHDVKLYDPAFRQQDFKYERELYDWADAVVIATPTPFHIAPLRACIERGKHALVEKPLATAMDPALTDLLRQAETKKLVIMMGNNLRFHAGVRRAREMIVMGKIAPVWANFICATPLIKNASDGVILSTGAHEVDVALHLFGPVQRVASACAHYSGIGTSTEDIADFTLIHDNGIRSTFHLDFVTSHRIREFRIAGETGNARVDLDSRMIWGNGMAYLGGDYDRDYIDEMRGFVSLIEGGEVPEAATGWDGLEALRVLEDVRTKAAFP